MVVGRIDRGLLVLLGVRETDTLEEAKFVAEKSAHLRIFSDEAGKMNRSVLDVGGAILVVSQFTLYGDCSRGRRPDFISAAPAPLAKELYEFFCEHLRTFGIQVEQGIFQADMQVSLVNDGPVTLMIERESS